MPVTRYQLLTGVGLDLALGDPTWLPHPVRAIGWLSHRAESLWRKTQLPLKLSGALFWFSVVSISAGALRLTIPRTNIYWVYSLLAARDLDLQAGRVIRSLEHSNLLQARHNLSLIVGRDTATLNEPEIVRAVFETVAENLSDGVIAPLFYLALGGPLGMAIYKAINTLDSMVGHKNDRYLNFGWFSARADDIANFIPSRLTALAICTAALLPGFSARRALRVTLRDGYTQPSPNAGYPEAAFAGALGVQLGGLNFYQGHPSPKAFLGDPIVPLHRRLFPRVRTLLYVSEALCLIALFRILKWQ